MWDRDDDASEKEGDFEELHFQGWWCNVCLSFCLCLPFSIFRTLKKSRLLTMLDREVGGYEERAINYLVL